MSAKVDLHVHTKFSDRSAEWLLRRFDFPASCSEPEDVYKLLKKRGMRFVTFTDYNRIDGCLEVAHHGDTFISEKVTTFFPGDRCVIQLLVWGITEDDHNQILELRHNLFDLQKFIAERGIAHCVAHPLYAVNQALTCEHIEKLVLLFKHFEGINGTRDGLLSETARWIFSHLTADKISELSEKHGIAPTHAEPWEKILVGGSDDHGGIFPGSTYTECDAADSVEQFLDALRAGRCRPAGAQGTPIALSHSLYNTIWEFLKSKFKTTQGPTLQLMEKGFSRFMEGKNPTEFNLGDKIGFITQGILSGKIFEMAKPGNMSLWAELSKSIDDADLKRTIARATEGIEEPERRAFVMSNMLANQMAYRFFEKFLREINSGNFMESIQSISAMVPVLLMLGPYLYAFQSQSPDRAWLDALCQKLGGDTPDFLRNTKRAWVTDTIEDVNGVSTTIRRMTAAAAESGADITLLTCLSHPVEEGVKTKNFQPIGEFELPEYELQKLSFPPVLEIVDYIQRERFTEVIISTPGPMGLAALLAAKMLRLRTTTIYHTDFPQYVRILTDDTFLESLTWNFMQWFYGQCDIVFLNSEFYRKCWAERGIPEHRLKILPRGLDLQLFNPQRRDREFWRSRGLKDNEVGLLYVGRVSKEKDLDVLVEAYHRLKKDKLPVRLLVVGLGPYETHMQEVAPEAIFTGFVGGVDLATAYASADIFAFPSTTDTFGNVILEAQASGLPCVVSDEGGPAELVIEGVNGFVTRGLDVGAFTKGLRKLVEQPELRATFSKASVEATRTRDWPNAFRAFWEMSPL